MGSYLECWDYFFVLFCFVFNHFLGPCRAQSFRIFLGSGTSLHHQYKFLCCCRNSYKRRYTVPLLSVSACLP